MNDRTLKLYHGLPSLVRSLAATARGFQLRHWRYGRETELLVAQALEREEWSAEQWKKWQEERLAFVLHRAATQVPYYRKQWNSRRQQGDKTSSQYIENWQILEKESLRKNPEAFVADDCEIKKMFHDHTSGTSGKSLDLWFRRETVRAWYALFEARWRRWYGVSLHDRWGLLGGQLITPIEQKSPPFWVWNLALKQLYLSSYHLSPQFIPSYLDAIARYELVYLLGYTSSLYALAQVANRLKRRDLKLRVVITNAEPVFDYQREVIAEAFQCPVRETYGMSEIVTAASECDFGTMHLWPEVGWIETAPDDIPNDNGTAGDLISTGLANADMPLVRYRVGDRISLAQTAIACPCGRGLPQLASIEGRTDDVLFTSDGRRIGRLDPVFKAQLPIQEAQIIQERLNLIRVRYVPDPEFSIKDGHSIIERLKARMGNVDIKLEPIDEIPRGANGKFRAVICNLPPEEIEELNRLNQHNAPLPPCTPGSIEIRSLDQQDLSAVARIHLAAFPDSALTALGLEAVQRYYDWQLTGPHDVSALGACDGKELAGFCVGGVFRGAMSGFLHKNQGFLVWRVATHPWLAFNPLFRDRLAMGVSVLHRFSKQRKNVALTQAIKQPRFGILSIGVSPKFQGRGIGKMLMAESETIARQRGFEEMQLSVNPDNDQAVRFYESLGWKKITRDNIWKGEMIKLL